MNNDKSLWLFAKALTVFVYAASRPRVSECFVICSCILFLSPECMYFTSVDMKQLNCRKFSVPVVGGSSSDSVHLNSVSKLPPKYCLMNDLGFNIAPSVEDVGTQVGSDARLPLVSASKQLRNSTSCCKKNRNLYYTPFELFRKLKINV